MDTLPHDHVAPDSRSAWRAWLAAHHAERTYVWLVFHKKESGKPSVRYGEAVDEALCFGWIDSKAQPIDAHQYRQYFCRRKPKSVWSAVNKAKVIQLTEAGLMQPAGQRSIDLAKENGAWATIDDAEALVVPPELSEALLAYPEVEAYFDKLARSNKRNVLMWLLLAKQAETRSRRIHELLECLQRHTLPKQFLPRKKTADAASGE
jgi:uncharacterized protein YdeI (YjbR/CyaY-like superfamily)